MNPTDHCRATYYNGNKNKGNLKCSWTTILLVFLLFSSSAHGLSRQQNAPACRRHMRAHFLECSGITSQTQYEDALGSVETGSEHFTRFTGLSVHVHPFVGHLTSRAFSFEHFHRKKNQLVNSTFLNLEVLRLTNGRLADVDPDAFSHFCSSLIQLDLSLNSLVNIPSVQCTNEVILEDLNLTGNSISRVEEWSLKPLYKLKTIDLSNNSLQFISPQGAFVHSKFLQSIYLHRNYLMTISESAFLPSRRRIDRLTLTYNRLNCDCSLRWLVRFLNSNVNVTDEPLCQNPPSKRHYSSLKLMDPSEFICEPLMTGRAISGQQVDVKLGSQKVDPRARPLSQTGEEILVFDGDRLVLECQVFSNPHSHVWWTFRDRTTIGKTLEDGGGRPTRHTIIPRQSPDGFNVSLSLIIDPVLIEDSGVYKCVSLLQLNSRSLHPTAESSQFLIEQPTFLPSSLSVNETFLLFEVKVKLKNLGRAYNATLWLLLMFTTLAFLGVLVFLFIYRNRLNCFNTKHELDGCCDRNEKLSECCGTPLLNGISNGATESNYLDNSAGLDIALGPPMYQGISTTLATYQASSRDMIPEIDMSGYEEDYRFTDDIYRPDQPIDPRRKGVRGVGEDSGIGVDRYRRCLGYPNLEALRLIKTKVSHRFLNECIIRPLLLVINNYPDEFSLNIAELIRGNAVQPNTTIVIDQDNNPNLLLSRPSPLAVNTLKNISLMLTLSKCPTCRDHEFHWLLALAQQSPFSTIRCKNGSILVNLPFVTPEATTNLLSSNATQNLSNQAYRFIVSEGCHEPIPIWVVFFMFFYDFVLLLICLALIARIRSIDETRKRLRRYRKENTGEVQSSTRPHESHFEELIENDKDDNPSIGLGTIPRRRILKSSSGNSFDDQDETELYHF
ncbi:hypothetical protein ACOME3_002638 [Neoechinorhynchus agilis]